VPSGCVAQASLEGFLGLGEGYVTRGLGQEWLAFHTLREDAVSMALTACARLLERHGVDGSEIGRVEVGSESGADRSKPIRSFVAGLLRSRGSDGDVRGSDCVSACHGGAAALLNAADWVEGSAWDGRLALVVATDSSLYPAGVARPTQGCGAVAMLVGAGAPLQLDLRGAEAFQSGHAYDFWLPHPASPFPEVDGPESKARYLDTLEACYRRWRAKPGVPAGGVAGRHGGVDFVAMHTPYLKLVRRGFARLLHVDAELSSVCPAAVVAAAADGVGGEGLGREGLGGEGLGGEGLGGEGLGGEEDVLFAAKGRPAQAIPRVVGNMYTASLFSAIASVLIGGEAAGTGGPAMAARIAGRRVLCFSYGSGSTGALFALKAVDVEGRFSLASLCEKCLASAQPTLDAGQRRVETPETFSAVMDARVAAWGRPVQASELGPVEGIVPLGAYYLDSRDARGRAIYLRHPDESRV